MRPDPTPDLETDRLRLRKLTPGDADAVFAYASDPEVARYMAFTAHTSLADADAFIALERGRYDAREPATWAIVEKATNQLVGCVGFVREAAAHRRAEIGYVLRRDAWGRGLAPEAVRGVLAFGFGQLGLHRIEAFCKVENAASARVMEKVGMAYEGVLRGYVWKEGRPRDVKMYSILASEWAWP